MDTKWNKIFIKLAYQVSRWSKDPSTKVGAVITRGKNIVSVGYNGYPANVPDTQDKDLREIRCRKTIHAETNAILTARQDLEGAALFCTNHPCAQCAAIIIQAGISTVYVSKQDSAFTKRWEQDIEIAQQLFSQAGVTVEVIDSTE